MALRKKLPKPLVKLGGDTAQDSIVEGASDKDDIVPVIGMTGSGKSTFINTYLGNEVAPVGRDLLSSTANVNHYIAESHPFDNNRRLILVDTPGFDDTFTDDAEILRRIAFWLGRSYHDGMKLAGIVYLHEISLDRVSGTAINNHSMFKEICGDNALQRVVMATTKWERLRDENDGFRRQTQLQEVFWQPMTRHGSQMTRFKDSQESAQQIVHKILKSKLTTDVNLRIQRELVDLQRFLPQTDAGKLLFQDLKLVLVRHQDQLARLEETNVAEQDEVWKAEYDELQKRIETILGEIEQLKVPLIHKILGFFGINRG